MKVCTKCGVEKSLDQFSKNSSKKDGLQSHCKECRRAHAKSKRVVYEYEPDAIVACVKCGEEKKASEFGKHKHRKHGVDKTCKVCARAKARKWHEDNKERSNESSRRWGANNPERRKEFNREAYKRNEAKYIARAKKWKEENPERFKELTNRRRKERMESDIQYNVTQRLRWVTSKLGDYKNKSTIELVGISPEEFHRRNGSPSVEELKDLDIDHIVPLSWFDLTNEEHVRVACNWTNLQYLNSNDNRFHKRDRYAGTPEAILGYRDEFDLEKHVTDMVEFLNDYNLL